MQIADLCEKGGAPLDTSSSRALSQSLEAAVRAAPDSATAALIKSLATRAMSEAEYLPAGRKFPIYVKQTSACLHIFMLTPFSTSRSSDGVSLKQYSNSATAQCLMHK